MKYLAIVLFFCIPSDAYTNSPQVKRDLSGNIIEIVEDGVVYSFSFDETGKFKVCTKNRQKANCSNLYDKYESFYTVEKDGKGRIIQIRNEKGTKYSISYDQKNFPKDCKKDAQDIVCGNILTMYAPLFHRQFEKISPAIEAYLKQINNGSAINRKEKCEKELPKSEEDARMKICLELPENHAFKCGIPERRGVYFYVEDRKCKEGVISINTFRSDATKSAPIIGGNEGKSVDKPTEDTQDGI